MLQEMQIQRRADQERFEAQRRAGEERHQAYKKVGKLEEQRWADQASHLEKLKGATLG